MIAQEINESEYEVLATATAYIDPGEYGPLDCACCIVSVLMDPVGPRLVFVMVRKDAEPGHRHETLADFELVLP